MATITSKGQVTIPKKIREYLMVKPGDQLDFTVEKDGLVVLRPSILSIRELKGILRLPGRRPVSLDKMEAAILKAHDSLKAHDNRGI